MYKVNNLRTLDFLWKLVEGRGTAKYRNNTQIQDFYLEVNHALCRWVFFFLIFLTVWFCVLYFLLLPHFKSNLNKFKYFLLRRQNSQIVKIKFIILLHDIINLARKRDLSLDEIITIYTHVRLSKQTIP